jgi:hypothetical protein
MGNYDMQTTKAKRQEINAKIEIAEKQIEYLTLKTELIKHEDKLILKRFYVSCLQTLLLVLIAVNVYLYYT